MKSFYFIISLFLFLSKSFSQNAIGHIIWNNDSISTASFIIPYDNNLKNMCLYLVENEIKYSDTTSEIKTLKPKQVKKLDFVFKNDTVQLLPTPNLFGSKNDSTKIFLRLLLDGKVKLFCKYLLSTKYVGIGPDAISYSEIIAKPIIKGNNETFIKITQINFKRQMKLHVSGCKELTGKIISEEYGYGDLYKIIKTFNACVK